MTEGEASQQLAPLETGEAAALKAVARAEIRAWISVASDATVLARIDGLGAREIEAASAFTARLSAMAGDGRAEVLLDELNRRVSAIHAPLKRRGLQLFAPAPPPIEQRLSAAEPDLSLLLAELAGERDCLERFQVS